MKIASAIAVYFIIWWTTLFLTLPFGARSAHEAGESVEPGHAPSAPLRPMMGHKLVATTVLATAFFGLFYWLVPGGGLQLSDVWFLPDFTRAP